MPFDFLLDYLPAGVIVKPVIGMFYIYFDKKIVLIFRKTGKNPQHNGIQVGRGREFIYLIPPPAKSPEKQPG